MLVGKGFGSTRACVVDYRRHGYSWDAIAAIISRNINEDVIGRTLQRWFNDDPAVLAADEQQRARST